MPFVTLKPGTMLSPVPSVMVSCASETARPNIITIAWVGTACSQPPMLSIAVRKERFSHHIIQESGEFVVNLVGEELLDANDFCGVKSGRDVDKFAACGLTAVRVPEMRYAPAIAEAPLYLACRTKTILELGSHDLFVAEIVATGVQEALMDERGRLDLAKARLVTYSHGEYRRVGEPVGFFGHSVAAPEVRSRRMKQMREE